MRNPGAENLNKKILIILHQQQSSSGWVGHLLRQRGYELDIRRPACGDSLPKSLVDHSGAIIFGGPMSANGEESYIRQEIDWISVPLKENKPYLGICLGAQMLARNLGAHVGAHTEELVEIGYYPLHPTAEGQAMMSWPGHVYHWHREGFELPSGACLLASSTDYPNQAIRVGERAFGVQFHPEISYAILTRWLTIAGYRLALPGARPRALHAEYHYRYALEVRRWMDNFLDLWLDENLQSASVRCA